MLIMHFFYFCCCLKIVVALVGDLCVAGNTCACCSSTGSKLFVKIINQQLSRQEKLSLAGIGILFYI